MSQVVKSLLVGSTLSSEIKDDLQLSNTVFHEATPTQRLHIMTKICVDLRNQLSKMKVRNQSERTKWVDEKRELTLALENERSRKTDLIDQKTNIREQLMDRVAERDQRVSKLQSKIFELKE